MRVQLLCICAFALFCEESFAARDVGIFIPQRHAFVYSAEDNDRGGLGAELSGTRSGSVGLAQKTGPVGLEFNWFKSAWGATGPLARFRIAPWAVQLRADQPIKEGWDGQMQIGHAWSGPAMGALSLAFEFGLTLRQFLANDKDPVSSTSLAGGFWGLVATYRLWNIQAESSLLAFSLSNHGRWGFHRDSSSLRLRAGRALDETQDSRVWGEFFHLHRTFTNSEVGFSRALFVSDVTLALGLTRQF
jgi:hypothetical protein